MEVEVRIPQIFRKYTGGLKQVKGNGKTIRELFDHLDLDYPGIKAQILTSEGELHRFVNVYLNDEDIRFLQNMDTSLGEGDVVSILPAVAGGGQLSAISSQLKGQSYEGERHS